MIMYSASWCPTKGGFPHFWKIRLFLSSKCYVNNDSYVVDVTSECYVNNSKKKCYAPPLPKNPPFSSKLTGSTACKNLSNSKINAIFKNSDSGHWLWLLYWSFFDKNFGFSKARLSTVLWLLVLKYRIDLVFFSHMSVLKLNHWQSHSKVG